MGKSTKKVLICDLCEDEFVDHGSDLHGLRIRRGSYLNDHFGGQFPSATFICVGCVRASSVLTDLVKNVVWKHDEND